MNELITYHFSNSDLRQITDENNVNWFVCKDIAIALDYNQKNLRQNLSNVFSIVPSQWKRIITLPEPVYGNKNIRNTLCVTLEGLYFFACRSNKPKAITFQEWLASEVLPSIHNKGYYVKPNLEEKLPKPSEFLTSLELKLNPYQNEKLIEFLDADILMPERLPSEIGVRTEQFTDVFERNGKAVTSSLVVAEVFQKKHSSVMRSIESLITKIRGTYPNEDYESLFYSGTYIANNNREYKSYCITRQGFVFLVFSFTGTRAMQYKYPLYRRLEEYDTLLLVRRITEDNQSYKTKRMLCLHDLSKQEI